MTLNPDPAHPDTTTDPTAGLRADMVRALRDLDAIRSEPVAAAFRAVPRHLFAPHDSLDTAYDANTSVWPKRDENGRVTSTVSAAHIQAVQLEQADIRPGMRVLEIGSGGVNAALLAELVGSSGDVTTVDIDPEIVDRARVCLDTAGYERVRTVLADADSGIGEHGPYDRVVVTVRSWDIPHGWVTHLAPGGRIVVPLQLRSWTRTVALDLADHAAQTSDSADLADGAGMSDGAVLRGGDVRLASFVPMQGTGGHDDLIALITTGPDTEDGPGRVQLRVDSLTGEHLLDLDTLAAAIGAAATGPDRHTPVIEWTGVEFTHVDDLDLWLGLRLPVAGILTADREITHTIGTTSLTRAGAPALVSPGGFAYRTKRPRPDGTYETGVLAWGPDATGLATEYADTVRAWGSYRATGGTGPRLSIYPASAALTPGPDERVLDKTHTRIVVSWPATP